MASPLASRRRRLVLVVVGAVVVLGAGFAAGRLVRSPAQQAADAAGPGPTLLTVAVEQRVLTAQVVTRGTVGAGTQTTLTGPATPGAAVVTRVAVGAGQEIAQGEVLAEVSGRPVYALAGSVPAYRDLKPGYQGDDVRQLQQDLADMGFDPGVIDGVYGEATKQAVRAFYAAIGYDPLPASEGDEQLVRSAAAAVQQAQWALEDARDALGQANAALAKAQSDLVGADPGDQAVQSAGQQAVEAAQTAARAAQKALDRAGQQLAEAQAGQRDVTTKAGPIVPLGEYAFVPAFPARVASVDASAGAAPGPALLTIAAGGLQAQGTVNAGQAALIRVGQPVDVWLDISDLRAVGLVAEVGVITGADPDAGSSRLVVTPEGQWPSQFWGQNVRLTIDGGSTEGEALVVPVSALFASADGSVKVTAVARDGAQSDVTVTVGVTSNGYAAITPQDGHLGPGDQVVVSGDNATPGG
ncbi:MAG: peptidoglycan-binding protein [Propionibacteriaceae bacterium]|nr:peptidoglycan-binding protein [Propionibacteriaceae bacterium]